MDNYDKIFIHERNPKTMAYKQGERTQYLMFPPSIEDSIPEDDPVRLYREIVSVMNFIDLGIILDENKVGNSSYHPRQMLTLLVYAYSYGWRSSRKIERAVHHNISFIWLMDGLKPDHKTISEFRRKNKDAIKKALKQCAQICLKLKIIEGSSLFIDGTKIRAQASRSKNYTKKQYHKLLKEVDKRIENILNETEEIDQAEAGQGSLVKLRKDLQNTKELRKQLKAVLKEFKEYEKAEKTINLTDPESKLLKSRQGSHASYNVQTVVDDTHGLIVTAETEGKATDHGQLSTQVTAAEETLGKQVETVCADAGYYDIDDITKLDEQDKKVIVPNNNQASNKKVSKFSKQNFEYDKENDEYICPKGHRLYRSRFDEQKNKYQYRMKKTDLCKKCEHFGTCTKAKRGRNIYRNKNEEVHIKMMQKYKTEEAQKIYAQRKSKVEHPFGHIKRNLGITQFLLKGIKGVNAEIALGAICFNIARIITIYGGVEKAINAIIPLKG